MDVSSISPYTVPVNQPQTMPEKPQPPQEPVPAPEGGVSGVAPQVPENVSSFNSYA